MEFNPEPYNIPAALVQWLAVFGCVATIVVLLILFKLLLTGGVSGVRSVFRALLATPHQKVGAVLGALLGAAGGANVGWLYGPRVLAALGSQMGFAPASGALSVSQYVGLLLAGVIGLLVGTFIGGAVADTLWAVPRRVLAIASLTFKEALRRKALLVFVVFTVLFMFAGWFLSNAGDRPEMQVKVYVSFVLGAITWLILPVVLLLACWGLPEDIRLRSLHTVVTKPVRRNEIVLGRMLGFTAIGTLVLLVMGAVGYVWIQRQVPEKARDQLVSRVPHYGSLSFLDRNGAPTEAGINVGDIWEFRSYIEGATRARAIYSFQNVTPDVMVSVPGPDGDAVRRLRLESGFEAFRTHKGEIGETIRYQYTFTNPQRTVQVPYQVQRIQEFRENLTDVDPRITYFDPTEKKLKTVDLFEDVAENGRLDIVVACVDQQQYLGMARPDLFIRQPDKHFSVGYWKAIFSIWMMMVLIIMLGVTASCFVKGPVATLLTFSLIVVGTGFHGFLEELVTTDMKGFGATESIYRIVEHLNPQVELEKSAGTTVMKATDEVITGGLWLVYNTIPNFNNFRATPFVANGFDVPWDAAILPGLFTVLAFLIPCLLLAYYSLRLRELEAK